MNASRNRLLLLVGLSMSIGWGIRGQFGHEIGAAIAGALGAMALVLMSGREDWLKRIAYFAFLGAVGWGFGGSMSYMKVVAYSQSSDSATTLYGMAGLFLIGFLWAAPGGAGTAMAAVLDRERLTELFPAIAAVMGAWFAQDIAMDVWENIAKGPSLNLYDSDWMQATVAIVAVAVLCAVRRRVDTGSWLVLHLALGWWAAFAVLRVGLGLRLNPPRGDNWAGCIGVVAGLFVFCRQQKLPSVSRATWMTGLLGGAGFVMGQALKLCGIATGIQTNWHSVMEQTHGLFHGLGLAAALLPLVRLGPENPGEPRTKRWTETFCLFFVFWVIPYLNFRKSPADWIQAIKTIPDHMYGIAGMAGFAPSRGFVGWFDMVFIAYGIVLLALLRIHQQRPLALVPRDWLGKGQQLYLVFLWAFVFINFVHVIVRFAPQRLVTEWVITMNAIACTLLLLAWAAPVKRPTMEIRPAVAVALMMVTPFVGWAVERGLFGDQPTGNIYQNHIRFGPNNTNDKK